MKFNEIYKYAFDDKDLLMEVPHIKLPLAYSLDRDEIYFDAKVEKIPNDPSSMEIVDHFVKRFKKRKLNKMQRKIVYKNDMLNDIMNLKFNKTFSSPIDKENSNSMPIRDRIEFELEFDYLYDF